MVDGFNHPLFEFCDFLVCHCVCLRNNGNEIDFCMESAHKLDIDLFQATRDMSITNSLLKHEDSER